MSITGLQERYLNEIRKQNLSATFFLMNGFQMKGTVKAFDQFTIVIETGGVQELVFKHAISTIMPCQPIALNCLSAE